MRITIPSIFSVLVALTSAYTPANTATDPSGNAITHPGAGELMPAGQPYTITWDPSTSGQVSLLLLRGPATNVVPVMTIADSVDNTGSYVWNVPSSLEPDTTGYGIQLIVEGSGQYQYSTQCGVAGAAYAAAAVSSSSGTSAITSSSSGSLSGITSSGSSTGSFSSATPCSTSTNLTQVSRLSSSVQSTTYTAYATATPAAGTGNFSSPLLSPTKNMTIPTTLRSTVVVSESTSHAVSASSSVSKAASASPSAQTSAGAAVPGAVAWSAGSILVAGFVGALAL